MTTRINSTERAPLAPAERAKLHRRVARYIKQGVYRAQLNRMGYRDALIDLVAGEFGLELKPAPEQRKRKWTA